MEDTKMADIQKMLEEVKGMTVLELNELVKALEEEFITVMNETGLKESDNPPFVTFTLMPVLEKIFKAISDAFEFIFGGSDYWSFMINALKGILNMF